MIVMRGTSIGTTMASTATTIGLATTSIAIVAFRLSQLIIRVDDGYTSQLIATHSIIFNIFKPFI